jgi:hypothetical protein
MQNLRADAWPSCCQFICDGFPRPREQFIDPVDRVIGGPRDVSRKEASESSPLSLAISMSVYILALGFRRYPNRQRNNFFDLTQSRGHSANIGQEVVVQYRWHPLYDRGCVVFRASGAHRASWCTRS